MTDTTETTSNEPILFYFDFSSPYAYIAAHKIDQIAALYGREVDWRPTLLGAIFQQTGAKPLTETGLKAEYSKHDFLRTTRSFGLPFTMPDSFPFASIAAARTVWWLRDRDPALSRKVALAIFDKAFAEGGDVRGAEAVIAIAAEHGVDPDELRAALNDPAVKERLKTEVNASMDAGVCGAPFFIVDGEPFWGSDRLDQVERWLATGGW